MSVDNGEGTKIISLYDMKPPTGVSWNLTPFSLEDSHYQNCEGMYAIFISTRRHTPRERDLELLLPFILLRLGYLRTICLASTQSLHLNQPAHGKVPPKLTLLLSRPTAYLSDGEMSVIHCWKDDIRRE